MISDWKLKKVGSKYLELWSGVVISKKCHNKNVLTLKHNFWALESGTPHAHEVGSFFLCPQLNKLANALLANSSFVASVALSKTVSTPTTISTLTIQELSPILELGDGCLEHFDGDVLFWAVWVFRVQATHPVEHDGFFATANAAIYLIQLTRCDHLVEDETSLGVQGKHTG